MNVIMSCYKQISTNTSLKLFKSVVPARHISYHWTPYHLLWRSWSQRHLSHQQRQQTFPLRLKVEMKCTVRKWKRGSKDNEAVCEEVQS